MSAAVAGILVTPARRGSPRLVIARHVERSARTWALVWGLVLGLYVMTTIKSYAGLYPTIASRLKVATSLQAFSALLGPPRHVETVSGFAVWRVMTIAILIGAIWAARTSVGLLRGQEDLGQWELLLAGPTTKRRATGEALLGLGASAAEMYLVMAVFIVASGNLPGAHLTVGGSLLFALALVSSGVMFLAIGALASQLSTGRGQATTITMAVLGASFLIRVVADSRKEYSFLRWLSPAGWVEEFRPVRDTQPLALVLMAAFTVLCVVVTLRLAGRRDLQASILPEPQDHHRDARWLVGPTSLALRVSRPAALSWLGGLAVMCAVYGLLTRSSASLLAESPQISAALAKFGAHRASEAFLGVMFLMYSVTIATLAASQIGAIRDEEATGRLDNLLVRPVRRVSWLAGRLAISLALVVLAGIVVGFFTWVGAASQHSGVALSQMLEAGLNTLAPGVFVLGAGTLGLGLLPRLCVALAYGIVGYSFLVELVGSLIRGSDWLRDSSLFSHVALAPAATPDWGAAAIMMGLGLAAAILGAVAFRRRDVEFS